MIDQLPLQIQLPDFASFDNYHAPGNEEEVCALRGIATAARDATRSPAPRRLHLYGNSGTGKTHLLFATCRDVRAAGQPAGYISLSDTTVASDVLDTLSGPGVICIDDLHCAAGDLDRQRALVSVYERVRDSDGYLITAAVQGPQSLSFVLKDLISRVQSSVVYRLKPLTDQQKQQALRLRAAQRGFALSDDVVRYMLHRYARDTASLFALLDRVDHASLAAKRRVTIPFLQSLESTDR